MIKHVFCSVCYGLRICCIIDTSKKINKPNNLPLVDLQRERDWITKAAQWRVIKYSGNAQKWVKEERRRFWRCSSTNERAASYRSTVWLSRREIFPVHKLHKFLCLMAVKYSRTVLSAESVSADSFIHCLKILNKRPQKYIVMYISRV